MDQNTIDRGVMVETADLIQQFRLGGFYRELNKFASDASLS